MKILDTKPLPAWALEGETGGKSEIRERRSARTGTAVLTVVNKFWSSRQRAGHSLHEISYRACFKPELPQFFILRLTSPGDAVLDCFMGRGTTILEASLLGRVAWGNDLNPLGSILVAPRLDPPEAEAVAARLESYPWAGRLRCPADLRVFYHRDTLRELYNLRSALLEGEDTGRLDRVDRWIRMVAINRLTGHSPGFFSVYTLPPNQAVTVEAQRRINIRRGQVPPRRRVPELILKKSASLLRQPLAFPGSADIAGAGARLLTGEARAMEAIPDEAIQLVVTSPPFLDTVDYQADNWLRCWFAGIDPKKLAIRGIRSIEAWESEMDQVFSELYRVLAPGGIVAFEVGEIRNGSIDLEDYVLDIGMRHGLDPWFVLQHQHQFTKTAHCWGIQNGKGGTNSHRVVLFRKED